MHSKKYYIRLGNKYLPEKFRAIFILESPPSSGKYFYNASGRRTEPLYKAMMECVLGLSPVPKKDAGLKKFQEAGYFLVNATYVPVNEKSNKERNFQILKDFCNLVSDLKKITNNKNTRIILVKVNICQLLEPLLSGCGFNVINNGAVIPFPSHGWQKEFCRGIKKLIK